MTETTLGRRATAAGTAETPNSTPITANTTKTFHIFCSSAVTIEW